MRNTSEELQWIEAGFRKAGRSKTPQEPAGLEPIAIVGLSGYFPKGMSAAQFWESLDRDEMLIEEIPKSRFDWEPIYDPDGLDKTGLHTKWGGFIPDISGFDAQFFKVLPSQAKAMDPRQRLLLMSVYHCLEDAGYAPGSLKKSRTGVFIGAEDNEYIQSLAELGGDMGEPMGHTPSMIANRISYFFDFRGPSEFVNTMCSGAAIALHRAMGALRSGEISHAVVAGANLLLRPEPFMGLSAIGQLSPDQNVFSFGGRANGFVRAEGVASILLKPLSLAEADGDAVYAVIRNSAVNYNGQGGTSIAAPNVAAHTELIRQCYREANVDPRDICYIEAQGMGNPVADIAEWRAFNRALTALAKEQKVALPAGKCAVSTLKPMTGHMHAASALGALFKIIRSLQTNRIYKILNFQGLNPDLESPDQPCRPVTDSQAWPQGEKPRLAGLHSYGSGGNNAHLLIEEYQPKSQVSASLDGPVLIPVSAQSADQCRSIVQRLVDQMEQQPAGLIDIAHTLQVGRDSMTCRVAFVAEDAASWLSQARRFLAGQSAAGVFVGEADGRKRRVDSHTDLTALAQQWVTGASLNWALLSNGGRRLHLPTYPFAAKPYWFEAQPGAPLRDHHIAAPVEAGLSLEAEQALRQILAPFLDIAPRAVDMDAEFSSLGFDSLMVVNLASELEEHYGVKVEPALFFEHTTPHRLAQYLTRHFKSARADQEAIKARPVTFPRAKPSQPRRPSQGDRIAVIGLAGSYPKSPTTNDLWANLAAGRNCVEEVPADRWSLNAYFESDPELARQTGKSYGKWGGFLADLYQFDARFFNLSPREAEYMNPKDRIFLQTVWRVLEDAGYPPATLSEERVGVFAGVTRAGIDLQQSSPFSVANRVSYTFDFKGPSMTIDTACSSSLVAVHEACQKIRAGECSVAVAGGVHAFLHPTHFVALSHAQMLSPDGKCKTFGANADGMVPGEGVGAVLLKPLSRALRNQDQVYGVIRATAVNHGGKTNGFTVPNPKAHANLILDALERGGVDAARISYVEAHGTGTSLGDPIEIRGLTEAFRSTTSAAGFCRIGSIKSNIGHLEAAAGMSGITKLLLQIKHRQLVPSLHSGELNPHIDFAGSPFQVQQTLEAWNPVDPKGAAIPRMGCVSSFGAGGTNAHIIIEEPALQSPRSEAPEPNHQAVIVLSAKNDRLNDVVRNLLDHLTAVPQLDLLDLAHTLQVGRQPLEDRLGLVVDSLEELQTALQDYLKDPRAGDFHRGNVRGEGSNLALFADEDMAKGIEAWFQKRKYAKILDLWVQGYSFDWHRLYQGVKPRRISLPGYPFAKEYYRPPETDARTLEAHQPAQEVIHPLLQRNTSDLAQQRFTSTFTGREFFLSDHVVQGQKILPGVAYLEMVRAALEQAAAPLLIHSDHPPVIQIRNMVWARPIAVDDPLDIHIGLAAEDSLAQIHFEIYSPNESEVVIYSQGTAGFSHLTEPATLDLDGLKARINQHSLTPEDCHAAYQSFGIQYGPGFQGLESLHYQDGEVLAQVCIPEGIGIPADQFVLHPSLMDSALQACLGLMAGEDGAALKPSIPFALDELEILAPCAAGMWVWLRPSKESRSDAVRKVDIDLCDDNQQVCVRLKGFSSRVFQKEPAEGTIETQLTQRVWMDNPVTSELQVSDHSKHLVLFCGLDQLDPAVIQKQMEGVVCVGLLSNHDSPQQRFRDLSLQVFTHIAGIIKSKGRDKTLVQVLVPSSGEGRLLAGLTGLLKTAQQENGRVVGQLIEIDSRINRDELCVLIRTNAGIPAQDHVRYRQGQRLTAMPADLAVSEHVAVPWKEGGVYLITGGVGGLGLIFAKAIAAQCNGCTLILAGRSAMNPSIQAKLAFFKDLPVRVEYQAVDVTSEEAVNALVAEAARFGKLCGIIHSAGLVQDNFILKKSDREFDEVLAPKVAGALHLDHACGAMDLDFFVLFSSTSAVLGNPGQADYAAANAFLDAFAEYRNALGLQGKRQGRTLAVNWPFWQDGGMQIDDQARVMMGQIGMTPLRTQSGVQALIRGLSSNAAQMMVIEGEQERIRTFFSGAAPHKKPAPKKAKTVSMGSGELERKTTNFFKELLSTTLKLPASEIHVDADLEEYGIDSIMAMEMTNQLEATFGSLSKTLFFEYQTIGEVISFFLESYRDKIHELFSFTEQTVETKPGPTADGSLRSKRPMRLTRPAPHGEPARRSGGLEIAIIGLSGRYPEADNLDEYWQNLSQGRDCITQVPEDRWDWRQYYDADGQEPGAHYSKWGGFLRDVDKFDPLFFNIMPREAEFIEPQERLFLETAWAAMEDAGYGRTKAKAGLPLPDQVGVYAGVMYSEYQLYGAESSERGIPMTLGASYASIANRVSYLLDLNGPSMTLDTMCSSSLTTIHLACQDLVLGRTDMGLAGGVNLTVHPNKYMMLSIGKFISSGGRCESFGEGGDGYIPGEGVGVVLLKRLSDATRDGDHIYGVIQGTAVNHDGKTNGYSVPNPKAQSDVISRALRDADLDPRMVSYVEAHGTGTKLGDPIEITGLTKAFGADLEPGCCAIGSAKSNIGHCESAAGIAGVTKVLLQMKHGRLAPSLHSKALNSHIDFAKTPFVVNQELRDWERPVIDGRTVPRIAGISSFGAGGSNAHVIIQEYVESAEPACNPVHAPPFVIVLSTRNENRLLQMAKNLLDWLHSQPEEKIEIANLAHTLQVGREEMETRLGFLVENMADLKAGLKAFTDGDQTREFYRGQVKRGSKPAAAFNDDDDQAAVVEAWYEERNYAKLVELWVKGFGLDWAALYDTPPARISLPTYPFARDRYWVPSVENEQAKLAAETNVSITAPQTAGELITLKPVWERLPELKRAQRFPVPSATVVFIGGTQAQLAELSEIHAKAHTLNLRDDIDGMVEQLGVLGPLDHIVWIAPVPSNTLYPDTVVDDQNSGVIQVFRLVKALLALGYGSKELGWTLITSQSQAVLSGESTNPTHASVHGLAGCLAKEYPHWPLRLLDLEPGFDLGGLFELPVNPHGDALVRRGKDWYQQSLAPVAALPKASPLYRTNGVYVVIGGAGGIGAVWSKWMIEHYQAQIIWLGRRAGDARIQAKLDELSQAGPVPIYIQADAADEASLQRACQQIKRNFGRIHGVVHSAIVLLDGSLALMDEARFKSSLAAKVDTSVGLAKVFAGEDLDFALFFSSMTSFTKAPGQSNYAAGCVFKDTFATRLAVDLNCPVKVMNWGFWGSVGVAADAFHQERMAREGVGSIEPQDGMAALASLMASSLDQVGVMKVLPTPADKPPQADPKPEPITPGVNQPQSTSAQGSPESLETVQAKLTAVVRELLLLPQGHVLDGDAAFSDLGLDSISSVGFIRGLSKEFDTSFRETLVFDYPTIDALTAHIAAQLPQTKPIGIALQPSALPPESETQTGSFKTHLAEVIRRHKSVVPLQVEGSGPLLFCFHPMSGDVGVYSKLAEAAQQGFRVIGIRSKGFLTAETPLTSIEAMGVDHARVLMEIDPQGPYHLLGVSVGGTVAYECARQLQLQHKTIGSLWLGEAPLVENPGDGDLWDSDEANNWVMNANFLMIAMLHMDPEFRKRKAEGRVVWSDLEITPEETAGHQDLPLRLVTLMRERGVLQTQAMLSERLASMAQTHLINLRALSRYRAAPLPKPQNLKAVLLRTRTAKATSDQVYNPDYLTNIQSARGGFAHFLQGWETVLPELETTGVDGDNHFDLLSSPNTVQHVADTIARFMSLPQKLIQQPHPPAATGKIAVVGMAGQFPGATSADAFWNLLVSGESALSAVPLDRGWLEIADGSDELYGGFLTDIDGFDPHFFQIAPKEAELIDPAERFFLQEAWKAIEDAGVDPHSLSGKRWGVFCGNGGDYTLRLKDMVGVSPHVTNSSTPGRVSYSLNLTGPSLSVDVGCASSLMAVTQACDHLLLDRCDAAIAGGVSISSTPNLIRASWEMLSKSNRARVFHADAKGMIPAEAVGVVVLKQLSKALTDKDRIYGVIEGWASNNSGKTNGMAAPSVVAEEALFSDVYKRFEIDPATIGLVEANATGTPLGDIIEVQALSDAFGKHTQQRGFCALGSVENHMGHAWEASGMAHLFKVLLALKHRQIPGTLDVGAVNPAFDLENSPFFINPDTQAWPDLGPTRRAALSSFGTTGTSVHMVVSESPVMTLSVPNQIEKPTLIVLSAATDMALEQRCRDLKATLEEQAYSLSGLSANLLLRRAHFPVRCAYVVRSLDDLLMQLSGFINTRDTTFLGTALKKPRPALARLAKATAEKCGGDGAREDLELLADFYVQGLAFDLSHCFSEAAMTPLSLPGYPFAKKRCWFETPPDMGEPNNAVSQPNPAQDQSVSDVVRGLVMEITGYEAPEIDVDAPLSLFGMDSLMSIRLLAMINEHFSLEMDLSDLLDSNSIKLLAQLISSQLSGSIVEPVGPVDTSRVLSPQSHWVADRLSKLPDSFQLVQAEIRPAPAAVPNESDDRLLSECLQRGIAVFQHESTGFFLAHRSVGIEALLADSSGQEQQALWANLPAGSLVAPVSQEQYRNLYHSEVMKRSSWNIQHVYEVSASTLDLALLNQAMALVVANHDLLRTWFMSVGDIWAQVIAPEAALLVEPYGAKGLADFKTMVSNERSKLLDLGRLPIFRAWTCQINDTAYLGFVTHHALADAFTTTMLFTELMSYYHGLEKGEEPGLFPVNEQYWQYASKQADPGVYRKDKTIRYWRDELGGGPLSMQLPFVSDPKGGDQELLSVADVHMISLDEDLCERILAFNREYAVTHTQLFTGAIALMLIYGMDNARAVIHFYHNQRDRSSLLNTLGEFTNILFMLLEVSDQVGVIDMLRDVKKASAESLRYGKVDFAELLTAAGLGTYGNYYSQTGDVIVDSADIDTSTLDSSSSFGRSLYAEFSDQDSVPELQANGSLFYQILRVNRNIHLLVSYRKQLFDAAEMYALSGLIVGLVEAMVEAPKGSVKDLLVNLEDDLAGLKKQAARFPQSPVRKSFAPVSTRPGLESKRKKDLKRFPELIHLNRLTQGRPVFWIHGGLGGVEGYYKIAQNSPRPFYGIQARGWMTDRTPLTGVQAMAAYYIHAIQSVQPEGPYDLGGYSLGGLLAYEVARQLQELGEVVQTIVMLDSFDGAKNHTPDHLHGKLALFHAVNSSLTFTIRDQPEKVAETLLHRDEINSDLDEDAFVEQLIDLAKARGLTKTKKQLEIATQQNAGVVESYRVKDFTTQPLADPNAVTCYYFRNRSGVFLGEFEPYFTIPGVEISVDHTKYWSRWEELLPNFNIMDVDSSSHMTFLSEPRVHDTIIEFCQTLYSGHGMSETFFKDFKTKTKAAHAFEERRDAKNSDDEDQK